MVSGIMYRVWKWTGWKSAYESYISLRIWNYTREWWIV